MLLVLLGLWGGFIPFIGPYFGYGYDAGGGQAVAWMFTWDRLWRNILPAIAVVLGGLLLGPSGNRDNAGLGAVFALTGGIWFITGPAISQLWGTGGPGPPIGVPVGPDWLETLIQLGFFYGLGALITTVAAFALGRLTVRSAKR